jgi:Flp pilus assembly protein TadD
MAGAETGRTNMAALVLGRAAERRPDDMRVYTAVATVWLRLAEGQHDAAALSRALDATRTIMADGNPTPADLLLHGRALLLSGEAAGALPALRAATAQLPVDPRAYETLAVAAERADRLAEAKDALERLRTLARDEPTQAAAAARIAGLALRLDDPADAVRWLERAMRATNGDASLLPRLAEAQLASGAPALARETVQRAVAAGISSPTLQQVTAKLAKR